MTDEPPTEADVHAIVPELVEAGFLTIGRDAEGKETWTPTEEGARVGPILAMRGDDSGEVLAALLE